jgi:hypothetical protein
MFSRIRIGSPAFFSHFCRKESLKLGSSCFFYLTRGQQAAIFAASGIVIGAAVGALWPTHEIIFRTDGPGT